MRSVVSDDFIAGLEDKLMLTVCGPLSAGGSGAHMRDECSFQCMVVVSQVLSSPGRAADVSL